MENTYLGILRGKMLPMEFSAQMLLKGAEDRIFYLETAQMSGYTTRLTMKNALKTAAEQEPQDAQYKILMEELKNIRVNQAQDAASTKVEMGQPVLDWLGL